MSKTSKNNIVFTVIFFLSWFFIFSNRNLKESLLLTLAVCLIITLFDFFLPKN